MLAIKRVKDIMAGKKFTSSSGNHTPIPSYTGNNLTIPRDQGDNRAPELRTFTNPSQYVNTDAVPSDPGGHYGLVHYSGAPQNTQYGPTIPPHNTTQANNYNNHHFQQYNNQPHHPANTTHLPVPGSQQVHYRPDVVAVQIRPHSTRGRSADSLDEPIYGTYQTFHPEQRHVQPNQGPLSLGALPPRPSGIPTGVAYSQQRSLDDGDITPTNEITITYEGGGTLPRPRAPNKFRPVAKVTAKTRVDIHEVPSFARDNNTLSNKDKNIKNLNNLNETIYQSQSTNNTPQGTPKKMPPPPPRRSNSISESTKDSANSQYAYLRRGLSYGYMGVKNNLQPDLTPDLPPPPPAPQDSGNHQHLPEDFPPPPPPLTCITMANSARTGGNTTVTTTSTSNNNHNSSCPSTTQALLPPTSSSDIDSEIGGFRARRNDSNASFKVKILLVIL